VTWTADSTGSVVATARYDPFGALVASSGTVPDSRWQGSWLDTSVGLYYVGARWYAPDLGRHRIAVGPLTRSVVRLCCRGSMRYTPRAFGAARIRGPTSPSLRDGGTDQESPNHSCSTP
jgi:hypothetical protein